MAIELKSRAELEKMRRAGLLVYEVHQVLAEMVRPGVTTKELDRKAHEMCLKADAIPAFLNYPSNRQNVFPFPGVICSSLNSVIVHGIPNDEPLRDGDILSIDFGCSVDGFFGDAARTHAVGEISAAAKRLLEATEKSLELAIAQCLPGKRIGDISFAVQSYIEKQGLGVVREFVGHGIGKKMHEAPQVPNFGKAGQGRVLRPGMVLAIEPMVVQGGLRVQIAEDGWTALTVDGGLAAHFEHTVAITEGSPYVLTRP